MLQESIGSDPIALNGLASSISLDARLSQVFEITPAVNSTINLTNFYPGQPFDLIIKTDGSTPFIVTFGSGFVTTGTLNTGTSTDKAFTVSFRCLDTDAYERSRTTVLS